MFDFAWTEIALIGVVALVAIGPKDLPVAIKTIAGFIKKARRMAAEFQTHVDELVREADLHEVRDQINQIRNFDIRGEIEKAVDADGSIRSTLATNPLSTPFTPTVTPAVSEHDMAPSDLLVTPPPEFHAPHTDITPTDLTQAGATDVGGHEHEHGHDEAGVRVLERPADTTVRPTAADRARLNEAPAFIPPAVANPPAFIPPGMNRV